MKTHGNKALLFLSLLRATELFSAASDIEKSPPFAYAAMVYLAKYWDEKRGLTEGWERAALPPIWGFEAPKRSDIKRFRNTVMADVDMHKFALNGKWYYAIHATKLPDVDDQIVPRTDRVIVRSYIQDDLRDRDHLLGGLVGVGLGGHYASWIVATQKDYFDRCGAGVVTFGASNFGIVTAENQRHFEIASVGSSEDYIQLPEKKPMAGDKPYFAGASKEIAPFLESLIQRTKAGAVVVPWSELK